MEVDVEALARHVADEVRRLAERKHPVTCGEFLAGHLEMFIRCLPAAMEYKKRTEGAD